MKLRQRIIRFISWERYGIAAVIGSVLLGPPMGLFWLAVCLAAQHWWDKNNPELQLKIWRDVMREFPCSKCGALLASADEILWECPNGGRERGHSWLRIERKKK